MSPTGMAVYARVCGWTLARAHARSGDRIAIGAYLGKSDRFDKAIADFAAAYADQNDSDHAAPAPRHRRRRNRSDRRGVAAASLRPQVILRR